MSCYIRELSPLAYEGIELLSEENNWADLYSWMPLEYAALLFFRLRETPDSEQYFPKGKWATIQALEAIIIKEVKNETEEQTPRGRQRAL